MKRIMAGLVGALLLVSLTAAPAFAMAVYVKTLSGQTIEVNLESGTTIGDLKQDIANQTSIPVETMRLIFAGKQLEDGRTLGDYNIQPESTIHIVLRALTNDGSMTVPYGADATVVPLNILTAPDAVAVASTPAHGTATVEDTSITYMPRAGFYGADSFTYHATAGSIVSEETTVTITVTAPILTFGADSVPSARMGQPYSQQLSVFGGMPPYAFSVLGTLPEGLVLDGNSGEIFGTPTVAGTTTLQVIAADSSTPVPVTVASSEYTITVSPTLAPDKQVSPGKRPPTPPVLAETGA